MVKCHFTGIQLISFCTEFNFFSFEEKRNNPANHQVSTGSVFGRATSTLQEK